MKSKILALFAIVAVFGLAIATYAYSTTSVSDDKAKMSCCAKSDSCPMKASGHDHNGEHDGKSCPMAKHGSDHAKADGHDCCGDSCPMKKGEAAAAASATDGKSCCDDCDCCKGKSDASV